MGHTISESTYKRREAQAKTVKGLDEQFQKYGLRLLISLPDYKQVIEPADDRIRYMMDIKIREAKRLLRALQEGVINTRQVIQYIIKHGEPYLK